MEQTYSDGSFAEQPDDFKLRKLMVNLGNEYVRRTLRDRRKIMRLLEQFTFGKNTSVSYWDSWSKDDMKSCCRQLQLISPKMANTLRRWASELLKAGRNNKLALKCLMDELVVRTWIEEP